MEWTEAEIAQVKRLFHAGYTGAQAGERMRRSRHSVISRWHVLGLRRRKFEARDRHHKASEHAAKAVLALPNDLTECRWPIGDPREDGFHFCGAATDGNLYCKVHQARAHIRGSDDA